MNTLTSRATRKYYRQAKHELPKKNTYQTCRTC